MNLSEAESLTNRSCDGRKYFGEKKIFEVAIAGDSWR
jgi:hypothetical protein